MIFVRALAAGLGLAAIVPMTALAADGLIVRDSAGTVAETADRIEAIIESGPAMLVARVDHQANAATVDTEIAAATVLIFGNPALGTPIIAASPRAAFDLPVRILVWDEDGTTMIGYLDPAELKTRYGVEGADEAFDQMQAALGMIVDKASVAE